MPVEIKRVYDPVGPGDGARILVDGLWPRGISKAQLKTEQWMKAIAPSPALRKWYSHKPERWEEFRKRYRAELREAPRTALVRELTLRARREKITLVFAARDAERSNAAVIAEVIQEGG